MRKDIYLFCCALTLTSQTAFASEGGMLAFIKDYWWAVLFVPATLLLKRFLQKLDDQNRQ